MRCSPLDRLGFTMDKSCRLYVPFYRYNFSTNGKVQDLSPYGNHGTIVGGPGPWPVPIPGGEELVTNPYFTQGNPPTGWSTANGMESWVGNGAMGTWTDDPASQAYVYQDLPVLENGRQYVLRISSANSAFVADWFLRLTTAGGDLLSYNSLWCHANSQVAVVKGNGYPAQLQIGNPSAVNSADRRLLVASLRPLVGYESRGWAFDDIDDRIEFATFGTLGIQSELTVLVWVRFNCEKAVNENWGFTTHADFIVYEYGWYSTLYYDNGSMREIDLGFPGRDNLRWICRAITYKVGGAMRTYLNGVSTGATSDASAPIRDSLFKIGNAYNSNSPYFRFGELAVFSRAMSADEIMNYYLQTRHRYN